MALAAATATLFVAPASVASPAAAAAPTSPLITTVTTIVTGAQSVLSYIGYANDAYGLFLQYAAGQKPVSDLVKIQQAIAASTTAINAHDDALVNGFVKSCVDNADIALEGITTASPDQQMSAAAAAVSCVTLAKNEIPAEGQAGVDALGFALNTVGPVALFMQAYVGQPTDILLQDIRQANQALMAKLQPTCGVTPNASVDDVATTIADTEGPIPGTGGQAPIPGHGACYNYSRTAPQPTHGHLLAFPTGPGTGADPWTVTGDGEAEFSLGVFTNGYHVNWPVVTDNSIAIDQAMADTSYPVANSALNNRLWNAAIISGPSVAAVTSTKAYAPVQTFLAGDGGVLHNVQQSAAGGAFSNWASFDGFPMRSVAAMSNADGRVELFGLNRVGGIFHRWQSVPNDNTSWTPWAQFDGQLSSITVARNASGALQIFGANQNGNVWTRWQNLGADTIAKFRGPDDNKPAVDNWSPWVRMDGSIRRVAAGTNANGQITLIGSDGASGVYQRTQTAPNATDPSAAGNWTAWSGLGVSLSAIAVTGDPGQRLELFGTDGAGRVWWRSQTAVNSSTWTSGSQLVGDPMVGVAAAVDAAGFGALLGVDGSGQTFYRIVNLQGRIWGDWTLIPGTLAGIPVATPQGDLGTIEGASTSLTLTVSGGTAPYAWSISGLPPGISGGANGQIAGTPTTAGTYTVSATVMDTNGFTASVSFNWTITAITVPDVTGSSASTAEGELLGADLTPGSLTSIFDCDNVGLVTSQFPYAGAQVPEGTVVNLWVGSNRDPNNPRRVCP